MDDFFGFRFFRQFLDIKRERERKREREKVLLAANLSWCKWQKSCHRRFSKSFLDLNGAPLTVLLCGDRQHLVAIALQCPVGGLNEKGVHRWQIGERGGQQDVAGHHSQK